MSPQLKLHAAEDSETVNTKATTKNRTTNIPNRILTNSNNRTTNGPHSQQVQLKKQLNREICETNSLLIQDEKSIQN